MLTVEPLREGWSLLETAAWLEPGAGEAAASCLLASALPSPAVLGVAPDGGLVEGVAHHPGGATPWRPSPPGALLGLLRSAARLARLLDGRLEGLEPLRLDMVQLRLSRGGPPAGRELGFHRDQGGWLRALVCLAGPGTLCQDDAGAPREVPAGRTLLLATLNLEAATGGALKAPYHAAPDSSAPRLLMIADFSPLRSAPSDTGAAALRGYFDARRP